MNIQYVGYVVSPGGFRSVNNKTIRGTDLATVKRETTRYAREQWPTFNPTVGWEDEARRSWVVTRVRGRWGRPVCIGIAPIRLPAAS